MRVRYLPLNGADALSSALDIHRSPLPLAPQTSVRPVEVRTSIASHAHPLDLRDGAHGQGLSTTCSDQTAARNGHGALQTTRAAHRMEKFVRRGHRGRQQRGSAGASRTRDALLSDPHAEPASGELCLVGVPQSS